MNETGRAAACPVFSLKNRIGCVMMKARGGAQDAPEIF
jgi:hypothetical protein